MLPWSLVRRQAGADADHHVPTKRPSLRRRSRRWASGALAEQAPPNAHVPPERR